MSHTNWWPGIIVLAIGLLLGVGYLLFVRGRAQRRPPEPDERLADLDRRAQLLIDQLKELNADQHHLDEQQFAAEKSRLELEAAAALRARDDSVRVERSGVESRRIEAAAAAPAVQGWWARHPQLKGAAWGGGVVLFFAVLGLLLGQEQKPRGERGEITGRAPQTQPGADPSNPSSEPEDPGLKKALEQVKAQPDNIEAIAHLSHELIHRQQWDEANQLTERALGLNPFHIESRIHRAVLRAARGDEQGAVGALEHLTNDYPDAHEGLLFLGGLALQDQNPRRALEHFERYQAEAPASEHPTQLRQAIAMLRNQLGLPSR